MKAKVILSSPFSRKTFDVFNIIKSQKQHENLLTISNNFLLSKIVTFIIYLKWPITLRQSNTAGFKADLEAIIEKFPKHNIVLFPLEEDLIEIFLKTFQGSKHSPRLKYLLPDSKEFDILRNKKEFTWFCFENSLPVPRPYTIEEIKNPNFDFRPIILKPSIGSGSLGIKIIKSKEELSKVKPKPDEEFVIQELIENGKDVWGGFFLCQEGELIGYYGHKRIRTYPIAGGVTIYSRLDYNNEIKELGKLLIKSLRLSGLIMIEYLLDPKTSKFKMIEVNPRAWGSIMLSEFAGENFINGYINICLGHQHTIMKKKGDVFIRWIFPFDLLNFIKGRISLKIFTQLERKSTCYINFTYSNFYQSSVFLLFQLINPEKIVKLIKKTKHG